jgi:hypothetical protein
MNKKNKNLSAPYYSSDRRSLKLDIPSSHGPWPHGEDKELVVDKIYNWLKKMKMIESKNKLRNYISHFFEPKIGDIVQNNNPNCIHYKSKGIVISIEELNDDAGKIVKYCCRNSGQAWKRGTVLKKTMDQLCPCE